MSLLLLAALVLAAAIWFTMGRTRTVAPVAVEPLVDGELQAVEFFWRPG